jgi:hypothetical protein
MSDCLSEWLCGRSRAAVCTFCGRTAVCAEKLGEELLWLLLILLAEPNQIHRDWTVSEEKGKRRRKKGESRPARLVATR